MITSTNIKNFPIGTTKEWKFGLITRSIYRVSENKFEIDETAGQWVTAKVGKKTMNDLLVGKKSLLDLDWK